MKFFMEKNKEAGHRVTINIPQKTVNNSIFTELIKISQKTNINGFRKGKIPIKVIQKKYGDTVYYDVFKKLMQKFFYEFLNQEKIKIIGTPKYYMHQQSEKEKKYFEYSVTYEIYPEFQIKDIKLIQAKKIIVKITDEDIKKNIEKYTKKTDLWNTVNKSIKIYDRVTINYSVYENNKKIEKFNTRNIVFIVSENTLIPQLNHKIINHFINDIVFFKIKFHPFHPETELQNKEITFKIKIIKIEKKQESILENNIIDKIKKEHLNALNYQNIKNNFDMQINTITQKYLEEQIIQKIISKNPVLIPPMLFEEEIKILYKKYKQQYDENKKNILEYKYHINLDIKAKNRLYKQLILQKVISDNQLFPNEKNIQELIKKISLNYRKPIEIINLYKKNNHLKNQIKNIDLKNQAMNYLIKNIEIIKKYWTFEKFINYNWKNHEELFI